MEDRPKRPDLKFGQNGFLEARYDVYGMGTGQPVGEYGVDKDGKQIRTGTRVQFRGYSPTRIYDQHGAQGLAAAERVHSSLPFINLPPIIQGQMMDMVRRAYQGVASSHGVTPDQMTPAMRQEALGMQAPMGFLMKTQFSPMMLTRDEQTQFDGSVAFRQGRPTTIGRAFPALKGVKTIKDVMGAIVGANMPAFEYAAQIQSRTYGRDVSEVMSSMVTNAMEAIPQFSFDADYQDETGRFRRHSNDPVGFVVRRAIHGTSYDIRSEMMYGKPLSLDMPGAEGLTMGESLSGGEGGYNENWGVESFGEEGVSFKYLFGTAQPRTSLSIEMEKAPASIDSALMYQALTSPMHTFSLGQVEYTGERAEALYRYARQRYMGAGQTPRINDAQAWQLAWAMAKNPSMVSEWAEYAESGREIGYLGLRGIDLTAAPEEEETIGDSPWFQRQVRAVDAMPSGAEKQELMDYLHRRGGLRHSSDEPVNEGFERRIKSAIKMYTGSFNSNDYSEQPDGDWAIGDQAESYAPASMRGLESAKGVNPNQFGRAAEIVWDRVRGADPSLDKQYDPVYSPVFQKDNAGNIVLGSDGKPIQIGRELISPRHPLSFLSKKEEAELLRSRGNWKSTKPTSPSPSFGPTSPLGPKPALDAGSVRRGISKAMQMRPLGSIFAPPDDGTRVHDGLPSSRFRNPPRKRAFVDPSTISSDQSPRIDPNEERRMPRLRRRGMSRPANLGVGFAEEYRNGRPIEAWMPSGFGGSLSAPVRSSGYSVEVAKAVLSGSRSGLSKERLRQLLPGGQYAADILDGVSKQIWSGLRRDVSYRAPIGEGARDFVYPAQVLEEEALKAGGISEGLAAGYDMLRASGTPGAAKVAQVIQLAGFDTAGFAARVHDVSQRRGLDIEFDKNDPQAYMTAVSQLSEDAQAEYGSLAASPEDQFEGLVRYSDLMGGKVLGNGVSGRDITPGDAVSTALKRQLNSLQRDFKLSPETFDEVKQGVSSLGSYQQKRDFIAQKRAQMVSANMPQRTSASGPLPEGLDVSARTGSRSMRRLGTDPITGEYDPMARGGIVGNSVYAANGGVFNPNRPPRYVTDKAHGRDIFHPDRSRSYQAGKRGDTALDPKFTALGYHAGFIGERVATPNAVAGLTDEASAREYEDIGIHHVLGQVTDAIKSGGGTISLPGVATETALGIGNEVVGLMGAPGGFSSRVVDGKREIFYDPNARGTTIDQIAKGADQLRGFYSAEYSGLTSDEPRVQWLQGYLSGFSDTFFPKSDYLKDGREKAARAAIWLNQKVFSKFKKGTGVAEVFVAPGEDIDRRAGSLIQAVNMMSGDPRYKRSGKYVHSSITDAATEGGKVVSFSLRDIPEDDIQTTARSQVAPPQVAAPVAQPQSTISESQVPPSQPITPPQPITPEEQDVADAVPSPSSTMRPPNDQSDRWREAQQNPFLDLMDRADEDASRVRGRSAGLNRERDMANQLARGPLDQIAKDTRSSELRYAFEKSLGVNQAEQIFGRLSMDDIFALDKTPGMRSFRDLQRSARSSGAMSSILRRGIQDRRVSLLKSNFSYADEDGNIKLFSDETISSGMKEMFGMAGYHVSVGIDKDQVDLSLTQMSRDEYTAFRLERLREARANSSSREVYTPSSRSRLDPTYEGTLNRNSALAAYRDITGKTVDPQAYEHIVASMQGHIQGSFEAAAKADPNLTMREHAMKTLRSNYQRIDPNTGEIIGMSDDELSPAADALQVGWSMTHGGTSEAQSLRHRGYAQARQMYLTRAGDHMSSLKGFYGSFKQTGENARGFVTGQIGFDDQEGVWHTTVKSSVVEHAQDIVANLSEQSLEDIAALPGGARAATFNQRMYGGKGQAIKHALDQMVAGGEISETERSAVKEQLEFTVDHLVKAAGKIIGGEIERTSGSTFNGYTGKSAQTISNPKDARKLYDTYPEIKEALDAIGMTPEAASRLSHDKSIVVPLSNRQEAFSFGQGGGGGGGGGGDNLFGSIFNSPVGKILYGAYVGKRLWGMTMGPVVQQADSYGKSLSGMGMAFYGSDRMDLGSTELGYAARQAAVERYWGKGAWQSFGGFNDAIYAISGSGDWLSRGKANLGAAGGAVAGGAVASFMTAQLGSQLGIAGLGAAAPGILTAGLVTGGVIAAGWAGMEIYNAIAKPDVPLSYGKVASNITRDFATAGVGQHMTAAAKDLGVVDTAKNLYPGVHTDHMVMTPGYYAGATANDRTVLGQKYFGKPKQFLIDVYGEEKGSEIFIQGMKNTPIETRVSAGLTSSTPEMESFRKQVNLVSSITGQSFEDVSGGFSQLYKQLGKLDVQLSEGTLSKFSEEEQDFYHINGEGGFSALVARWGAKWGYSPSQSASELAQYASNLGYMPGEAGQPDVLANLMTIDDPLGLAKETARSQRVAALSSQSHGYYSSSTYMDANKMVSSLDLNQYQVGVTSSYAGSFQSAFGYVPESLMLSFGQAAALNPNARQANIVSSLTSLMGAGGYSPSVAGQAISNFASGVSNFSETQLRQMENALSGDFKAMSWEANQLGADMSRMQQYKWYNASGTPYWETNGTEAAKTLLATAFGSFGSRIPQLGALRAQGYIKFGTEGNKAQQLKDSYLTYDKNNPLFSPRGIAEWSFGSDKWTDQERQIMTPYMDAYMKGGERGVQIFKAQKSLGYQLAGIGVQFQQIALQENYLWGSQGGGTWDNPTAGSSWGIENRQIAFQYQSQQADFAAQKKRMEMQNYYSIQGENLNLQRMNVSNAYNLWSMDYSYNQGLMQRGWQRQDWGYQDTTRSLNYGWQMEDIDESLRYATGRERRQLLKQKDRSTTSYNLESEQIDRQRTRQETLWAAEDERFKKQKQYTLELQDLDLKSWTLQREQREKYYTMENEELSRKMKEFEEQKKLEAEQRELSRKYQYDQIQLQKSALGLQAQAAIEQMAYYKAEMDNLERQKDVAGTLGQIAQYDSVNVKLVFFRDAMNYMSRVQSSVSSDVRGIMDALTRLDGAKLDKLLQVMQELQ